MQVIARLLLSFTKLPLLLTPLTYIPVGNAEIDYFGHKMFDNDLIRGSLRASQYFTGEFFGPVHCDQPKNAEH